MFILNVPILVLAEFSDAMVPSRPAGSFFGRFVNSDGSLHSMVLHCEVSENYQKLSLFEDEDAFLESDEFFSFSTDYDPLTGRCCKETMIDTVKSLQLVSNTGLVERSSRIFHRLMILQSDASIVPE